VLPGRCPTGRTNTRIRGWLGRADQTAKVRGMFVHPSQVADIARRHPRCGARAGGERRDGQRPHDAAGRGAEPPEGLRRASPTRSATSQSCVAK
jgi:phenylacetate-CoA ligase